MKRKLISEESANGERGVIFTTFDGKQTIFRKYFADFQYKDYILTHPDLEVIINDPDAAFVEFEDGSAYLDLSAKALEVYLKGKET